MGSIMWMSKKGIIFFERSNAMLYRRSLTSYRNFPFQEQMSWFQETWSISKLKHRNCKDKQWVENSEAENGYFTFLAVPLFCFPRSKIIFAQGNFPGWTLRLWRNRLLLRLWTKLRMKRFLVWEQDPPPTMLWKRLVSVWRMEECPELWELLPQRERELR